MAIAYQLDTLDGIENDAIKDLYKEANGKFVLDVEGVEPAEAVNGLKTALVKERENAAAYKKLGTADEIAAKIAELEDKASKGGKASADQQAIIDQLKADYEGKLKERDDKIAQTWQRQASSDLKAELAKAGVVPEGLDLLAGFAASRIKFNDDGTPKVLSSDGSQPMIGSGANGGATLSDLAKELAGSIPHLVKDGGAGGGGKQPGSQGGKPEAKTVTRAVFDGMSQVERSDFSKSGGKVTDG
ncbi:hypothetical protein BV394_01990 [Brevirhabdus pacifica]|uniref:Uncharacterized protein n=1 Tax=Brevirhabdus pacifica TaxID=1267768 RepID=A0A1U7DFA2_9RHOB|nr:hypothetical protein [Brevirhabdus pacifica]APX88652.1 hypothetical protein BV394_01990 [Brevirhabdus pacifica]OWU79924.1 hypothetical protein ATO5_02680 [Loktanella sp. 22II-4b]PJJ86846.1 hypothetical protein CLV77_1406 [Brevirhabdus pacifica]